MTNDKWALVFKKLLQNFNCSLVERQKAFALDGFSCFLPEGFFFTVIVFSGLCTSVCIVVVPRRCSLQYSICRSSSLVWSLSGHGNMTETLRVKKCIFGLVWPWKLESKGKFSQFGPNFLCLQNKGACRSRAAIHAQVTVSGWMKQKRAIQCNSLGQRCVVLTGSCVLLEGGSCL